MSGYFLAATVSTFIALRSISEPVSQLIWLPALVDLQITAFGFGPAPPALCHSRQNESTSHAGLLPATTFLIPPGTSGFGLIQHHDVDCYVLRPEPIATH
ncbi:hypothetical protein GGU11DRAFT_746713 [Lentinula aff. detonsa]|nr:hypothetical protein GGU11DRAFT_746713 [Lentinula aff. detonsa]